MDNRGNQSIYDVGGVYDIVDGRLNDRNGELVWTEIADVRDLNIKSSSKFEEVTDAQLFFTKSDLKTGHIVTLRDKREYCVIRNIHDTFSDSCELLLRIDSVSNDKDELILLDEYNEDLKETNGFFEEDIVKVEETEFVFQGWKNRTIVWEREIKKVKLDEALEILKEHFEEDVEIV